MRSVLTKHGLSLRSQKIRTGIDHMTMKDMADGIRPRLEKVEQFARAFNLDVNEWRCLAGYQPVTTEVRSGADVLWDGLQVLQAENPDISIPLPRFHGSLRTLTPEEAESVLAKMREKISRGEV